MYKQTLLGEAYKDILLGWFASGPIFVVLWIIGATLMHIVELILMTFGAKVASFSFAKIDMTIFVCDTIVIITAFSITGILRQKYPYLLWSCSAGMLLSCILWSMFIFRLQYWRQ